MEKAQLGSKIVFSYLKWRDTSPLVSPRGFRHFESCWRYFTACWRAWAWGCSEGTVQPLMGEWLHQKVSRFVLLWSRRYFLPSGFKSVYPGDDATFTFPSMHESFPFPAWDSKPRKGLGVAFSTEPVQNVVFHFLCTLAELIQTQECVFSSQSLGHVLTWLFD